MAKNELGSYILKAKRKGKKHEVAVDGDVFYRFKDIKLYLSKNGYCVFNEGSGRKNRKTRYLHKVIMNRPGLVVDHVNRNKLDNRRRNLRYVDVKLNTWNSSSHKNSSSSYRGVSWHNIGNGGWRARVMRNGKSYRLGVYETEVEAKNAIDNFFKKYAILAK